MDSEKRELVRQIQNGLKEWSALNDEAKRTLATITERTIKQETPYYTDDEVEIINAPHKKWDEIYELMKLTHPE